MDLDKDDQAAANEHVLQKTDEESSVFAKTKVSSENNHLCDFQHMKNCADERCERVEYEPIGGWSSVSFLEEVRVTGTHASDRLCLSEIKESDLRNMKDSRQSQGDNKSENEALIDEMFEVPPKIVGMHKTPIFTMKYMKEEVAAGYEGEGTLVKNNTFSLENFDEFSAAVDQNGETDNTEQTLKCKKRKDFPLELQSPSQAVFPIPYTSLYEKPLDENLQTSYSQPLSDGNFVAVPNSLSHCCEFCGKVYASHHQLKRHTKNHTMEKVHKCDQCSTAFLRACDLVRHKRIHSGVKEVKCPDCSAQFAQASDLNRHRMVHTGERPFKCEFCDAAFSRSGNLNQHRRTHTGEKPYKCEDCGAAFSQGGLLTSHRRKHTGDMKHICFECGAAFTQGGDLTKHKRIHSGERPFKCEECGKGFMQSGHLMQHRRTHTGEKPFICKVCGEAYKQASHLAKHSLKHSKEYTQKKTRRS